MSLDAIAREQLDRARSSDGGRSSETVFGGHERSLRQTLVALRSGAAMGEHESPGDATLHVLQGRVQLRAGDAVWEGRSGDLLIIPDGRHGVAAMEDAVFLLTVAK